MRGIEFMAAAAIVALVGSSASGETAPQPTAVRLPAGEYLNGATWVRTPTVSELKALYPESAHKAGVGDGAIADCVVSVTGALDQCEIDQDNRPGLEFASATQEALKLFQMNPTAADGRPVEGLHIALQLWWHWPAPSTRAADPKFEVLPFPPLSGSSVQTSTSQSPGPFVIWNPDFVRRPEIYELMDLYPYAARMKRISGEAEIECQATREGALSNCIVLREAPSSQGFGEATRGVARYMKIRRTLPDGAPVEGGLVFFSMRWTL